MYVKKIVAKNFVLPGVQIFEFDKNFGLIDGQYENLEVLPVIHDFLNGGWNNHTMSLEKFYPKFASRENNMDIELDVLIEFTDEELEQMNNILFKNNFKKSMHTSWFYSIKAYYPYIFPIVTISPASDNANRSKDAIIAVGDHYAKFLNSNISKRNLLSVCAFYCVSQFRVVYYEYLNMKVEEDSLDLHHKYLGLLKSVFRYDENFIKKIGKLFYQIDDGDVLNYGDQEEYFNRHELIKKWYDSIDILRESEEIRRDFSNLLWQNLYSNLQIDYAVKTANETIDIRSLLINSNCIRPIEYSELSKILHIDSLKPEPIEKFEESFFDKVEEPEKVIESPVDLLDDKKVISSSLNDLIEDFEVLEEVQEEIIDKVSHLTKVDEESLKEKKDNKNKHKKENQIEKFNTLTETMDSDNLTEWK